MSQTNYAYHAGERRVAVRRRRRRRQRIRRIRQLLLCAITVLVICTGVGVLGKPGLAEQGMAIGNRGAKAGGNADMNLNLNEYPKELAEMLERNPETYDFVTSYPERKKYQEQEINLAGEVEPGKVPLLLQWDRRWGYDSYGTEMIAVAGCGPVCMTMAYIHLTQDTDMNPRKMAAFAHENGYDTEAGTSWSFFTEGADKLGLQGTEIGLDEVKMKSALDEGKVIICSMRPGDFTTTGHFILIRGYDAKGFVVNDPNSKENSEKHWKYDTLYSQIKCLWSIGA